MPSMGQEKRALLNQSICGRRGAGIWMSGPSGDRLKTRRTDDVRISFELPSPLPQQKMSSLTDGPSLNGDSP
jgi:hypothetical protein